MPLIIALFMGVLGNILSAVFRLFINKILWAGWRFYLFLAFWTSLYLILIAEITNWLQELLRNQDVFANQWWITGISLLPSNAAACMGIVGAAYLLFWIATFKRQISAKYKESLDSK